MKYTVIVNAYNIETGNVDKFPIDCTHADIRNIRQFCIDQLRNTEGFEFYIHELGNHHDWAHVIEH